ncbi:MAG TPA: 2-oxoglutarate dehydrogenase, E2 component, dihydrolipoamide succinyltransferase [Jiangellaceae bacterium]|nr:2-oxoglutarate dehydrogenase, E2 component, dihydrolipoamide succinyltransferase [Jiangellaceae bacterium]
MATSVTLPALGESVTEGTVTRWLKSVGDEVAVDEALLEISTDKVDTEIPSPVAGTLLEIKADEDATIEVGDELAVVGDEGESGGASATADQAEAQQEQAQPAAEQPQQEQKQQAQPQQAQPQQAQAETERAESPAQETSAKAGAGERTAVTLPALGESVTEGTVTRWLKSVGDEVAVDEALLEISTDKVDTEIPSPVAGTLLEISVSEDETVEVGAELAFVGTGDSGGGTDQAQAPSAPRQAAETEAPAPSQEQAPEPQPAAQEQPQQAPVEQPQEQPAQQQQEQSAQQPAKQADESAARSSTSGEEPYVTPLVRKLAKQHGVDLSSLTGSGVGGRIRKQDVLAAAEKAPEPQPAAPETPAEEQQIEISPLRGTTEKMSRMRKVIATRMVESLHTSAQLTTVVEVDVTAIARLRQRAKSDFEAREGVRLSFLPFFAKATVEALKAHPKLNAQVDMDKGEVTYFDTENLVIAVDTDRGLLVPVLKDAGDLNIAGLARKIDDLATRTRNNKIKPDELAGGTFTITNTGSRGALIDTPIINQPQVAILGTGSVVRRPMVVSDDNGNEGIAVRSMMYLSLSYDHRLVDGADAARFLNAVKDRLEAGRFEADLGLPTA